MEITTRKEINSHLKTYCPGADPNSFISICEWSNGEGWDINIDNRSFSLSLDELDAINYLTKALYYNDKEC